MLYEKMSIGGNMSKRYVVMLRVISGNMDIYFSDGTHVIIKDNIRKYIIKVNKGYKNPIMYCHCLLYPTKSIKDDECLWINLDCFIKKSDYDVYLLKYFNVYEKAKKMYIRYISESDYI